MTRLRWTLFAFIFLVLQPAMASEIVLNSRDQFNFALETMQRGQYPAAATEFQRFIHFFPGDEKIPEAHLLTGVCYLEARDYNKARHILRAVYQKYSNTEVGAKALFWIGESYFRQKAFLEAERYFQKVTQNYGLPSFKSGAIYRLAWARMYRGKWEQASETFRKIDQRSDLYLNAQDLAQKSLMGKELPYKSPTTAGVMGALLPGLGHAYCGRYKDGLMALAVNGLFIWASVESFHHGLDALGGMLGFLELGWYTGNIYSAVNSAHKYNRHLKNKFLQGLPDKLDLQLFASSNKTIGFALRINF